MMLLKVIGLMSVITVLASCSNTAEVASSVPVDPEAYVETEWKDLLPDNWHPPLILPSPAEDHKHAVDDGSLVEALDSQYIRIAGYMQPLTVVDNKVSHFLLMPFLEHHVQVHIHHEPNQIIFVELTQPLAIENPFQPFWVNGEMLLESSETDHGHAGYKLINATAEVYIY